MDSDEILELVKDGVIEPNQIDDFENLDPDLEAEQVRYGARIQELVANGDLDIDEAWKFFAGIASWKEYIITNF